MLLLQCFVCRCWRGLWCLQGWWCVLGARISEGLNLDFMHLHFGWHHFPDTLWSGWRIWRQSEVYLHLLSIKKKKRREAWGLDVFIDVMAGVPPAWGSASWGYKGEAQWCIAMLQLGFIFKWTRLLCTQNSFALVKRTFSACGCLALQQKTAYAAVAFSICPGDESCWGFTSLGSSHLICTANLHLWALAWPLQQWKGSLSEGRIVHWDLTRPQGFVKTSIFRTSGNFTS